MLFHSSFHSGLEMKFFLRDPQLFSPLFAAVSGFTRVIKQGEIVFMSYFHFPKYICSCFHPIQTQSKRVKKVNSVIQGGKRGKEKRVTGYSVLNNYLLWQLPGGPPQYDHHITSCHVASMCVIKVLVRRSYQLVALCPVH